MWAPANLVEWKRICTVRIPVVDWRYWVESVWAVMRAWRAFSPMISQDISQHKCSKMCREFHGFLRVDVKLVANVTLIWWCSLMLFKTSTQMPQLPIKCFNQDMLQPSNFLINTHCKQLLAIAVEDENPSNSIWIYSQDATLHSYRASFFGRSNGDLHSCSFCFVVISWCMRQLRQFLFRHQVCDCALCAAKK